MTQPAGAAAGPTKAGNLQGDVWKSFDQGGSWPQRGTSLDGQDSTSSPFLVDREWTDAYIPRGKTTKQARVYIGYHDFGPSIIWVNVSKDGAAALWFIFRYRFFD